MLAGYEVSVRLPPLGKDYNEFLKYERENRALCAQLSRVRNKKIESGISDALVDTPKRNILYLPHGVNSRYGGEHRQSAAMARR